MEKKYLYSIEVVKESRAVVQVEANNEAEAYVEADQLVETGNVEWATQDQTSTNITGRRPNQ